MPHKDYYQHNLPHYQQPGQSFFVTCVLQNAIPSFAISRLREYVKSSVDKYQMHQKISKDSEAYVKAKRDYLILKKRYFFHYDKLLAESNSPQIFLNHQNNLIILEEAIKFWDGLRLKNHAWCVMPNHIHWVITTFEKDESGKSVYLEDIMHSVKLFTARRINKNENLRGQLWKHESFETTIRNDSHFKNVVNYTIMNPVKAGLVKDWREWPASFIEDNSIMG